MKVLLIRKVHRELWDLFKEQVLDSPNFYGMLCLGPPGIGKSWAGMYFLIQAIQLGRTVVFESEYRKAVWVFSSSGSRKFDIGSGTCAELDSKSTIHIFDA